MRWHAPALALAGIDAARLSAPVPAIYRLSGLRPADAAALGLPADTPFIVGGADGPLANLGVGAIGPGDCAVTIGTSGAVRSVVRRPTADPHGRLFCYHLHADYWVVGGAVNNGGSMLRWLRDELATLEAAEARSRGEDPYDALLRLAADVPAGADGLLCLPYWAGERAPHWNANARGVLFGLTLRHGKAHMVRAVLEGVLFGLRSVVAALAETYGAQREFAPPAASPARRYGRQMLADMTGVPLVVADTVEGSAAGAAFLGWLAVGEFTRLEQVHDWQATGSRHEPDAANSRVYDELAPAVRGRLRRLARAVRHGRGFPTTIKR